MTDKISRRTASAADGVAWLTDSFLLVFKAPLAIIGLFFAWFVVICILNFIPVLGGMVVQILTPILMAGVYAFCRQLDKGESGSIDFNLFLSPFQDKMKLTQLALLGVINIMVFVGLVIMAFLLVFVLIGSFSFSFEKASEISMVGLFVFGLVGLLATTIGALFAACNWLAVPLIMFANLKVIDALKESLMACFANIISTLAFGCVAILALITPGVLLGLALFVSNVPLGLTLLFSNIGLALGLIVTLPALFISSYMAYKSIYLSESIIEQT